MMKNECKMLALKIVIIILQKTTLKGIEKLTKQRHKHKICLNYINLLNLHLESLLK